MNCRHVISLLAFQFLAVVTLGQSSRPCVPVSGGKIKSIDISRVPTHELQILVLDSEDKNHLPLAGVSLRLLTPPLPNETPSTKLECTYLTSSEGPLRISIPFPIPGVMNYYIMELRLGGLYYGTQGLKIEPTSATHYETIELQRPK
jgi:hypothetical protein